MIDPLDVSVPTQVLIPQTASIEGCGYHAWRRDARGIWYVWNKYGRAYGVALLDEVEDLAAPMRPWWPAPPPLPYIDADGDRYDIGPAGILRRHDDGHSVYVADVLALAAALAAHRLHPQAP